MLCRRLFRLGSLIHQTRRMTTQPNKFLTMAVDFKEENGKEYAEITTPGFSFTDFDRTGKLGLHSLMQFYEGVRTANAAVLKCPDYWRIAREGLLWFIISGNYQFEERFFQHHRKNVMAPLLIKSHTGKIGRTSFILKSDVFDVDQGSKIMTYNVSSCLVNQDSHKPEELPVWFREAMQKHQTDCDPKRLSPQEAPDGAFVYQNMTAPSDTDFNDHVNQSTFGRMIIDCAVEASLSGFYKQYEGDFAEYILNEVNCLYLAQVNAGDVVITKTWEDDKDNKVIYFSMENAANNVKVFWARLTTHGHQSDIIP